VCGGREPSKISIKLNFEWPEKEFAMYFVWTGLEI